MNQLWPLDFSAWASRWQAETRFADPRLVTNYSAFLLYNSISWGCKTVFLHRFPNSTYMSVGGQVTHWNIDLIARSKMRGPDWTLGHWWIFREIINSVSKGPKRHRGIREETGNQSPERWACKCQAREQPQPGFLWRPHLNLTAQQPFPLHQAPGRTSWPWVKPVLLCNCRYI